MEGEGKQEKVEMITDEQIAIICNVLLGDLFDGLEASCENIVQRWMQDEEKGMDMAKLEAHAIFEEKVMGRIGLGRGDDRNILLFVMDIIRQREIAETDLSIGYLERACMWRSVEPQVKRYLEKIEAKTFRERIDKDTYKGKIHRLMEYALLNLNLNIKKMYNKIAEEQDDGDKRK